LGYRGPHKTPIVSTAAYTAAAFRVSGMKKMKAFATMIVVAMK
jgi:hypothetical protein